MKEHAIPVDFFKHADSHVTWELQQNYDYTSPRILLPKFRKEWRWFLTPIAWARNPEKNGIPMFPLDQEVIVAVYPKNFFIKIDRNDMFGPHPARLMYRSHQIKTEIAWIAICQIEGMWHSDERLLKSLNHEIRNKQLWHSQETANTSVML